MVVASSAVNTEKLQNILIKWGLNNSVDLDWEYIESSKNIHAWRNVLEVLAMPNMFNNPSDVVSIPYLDTAGKQVLQSNGLPYVRYRMMSTEYSKCKYLSPKNSGMHLYFSPTVAPHVWDKVKQNKTIPLILVEGEKKAEYLNQILTKDKNPLAYAIGLAGIWGWVVSKSKIGENKGLVYLMQAISSAKSDHLKKVLSNLEGDAKKEMMEVLEAWHEMEAIDKATNKQNSRPIDGKLEDWILYKSTNKVYSGYTEAINWNLQEELEELKNHFSASKYSAIVNRVNKTLSAKEEQTKEGYTITPELQQFKLHGRTVLICFDSDIQGSGINEQGHYLTGSIAGAARHLSIELTKLEATPKLMLLPKPVRLPENINQSGIPSDPDEYDKFGVDDYGLTYSETAIIDLVKTSIFKEELAVSPSPLEPLTSRKNLNTYRLNLKADEPTYTCWLRSFLRDRANLAYRNNDSTYLWNGKHWEKLYSEFLETAVAKAYLSASVGREIKINKSDVLEMLTIPEKLWNHKSNAWVLYGNGSYNFFTKEFKLGFDKFDYCTYAPITAKYRDLLDFNPDTFETLVEYIHYYSGGDERFLQYLMACIRWTVAPKSNYEKLPIEKFFSLVGHQGSGKSTMLTMIQKAVGLDNCHKFTKDRLGTPEGLHQYSDKKMLFNSDASGTISKEAAENINMMVSGEIVETRALFKQSRQIKMQPVIWLAGNEILNFGITGTQGLSRRLITIPIERNKGLKVDGYLTNKLTSEEFQSALFWLYRQLDEQDMVAILNHTRYLPLTVKHRTIEHGKEQNPLREFWEHLDNKWSQHNKQDKGFTREELMIAFKTWAEINNQFEYKVQKIMVHLKEIDAVSPKLNEKGIQYKYSGVPYFVLNPYKDHSTTDLRLTYDENNGRPDIIINPHDFLNDTSQEIPIKEELPTIMERLTQAKEKREDTIKKPETENITQTTDDQRVDLSQEHLIREAPIHMEQTGNSNISNDSVEHDKQAESLHEFDTLPHAQQSFTDWELDLNGTDSKTQIYRPLGSLEKLWLETSDSDESGDIGETYLY